jgi:hypothetical protein
MHFLHNRIDNRKNMQNTEICLLLEAGSSVSDEKATTSDLRNQLIRERYINLVGGFQLENFISPSLQEEMSMKLFNVKKVMTGDHLWEKFEDWRKEISMQYSPKIPKDLSRIPSGQQPRDVYKKFIMDQLKEENVSTFSSTISLSLELTFSLLFFSEEKCDGYEDQDIIPFIPNDYWLKGVKTRCLLACMVQWINKEIPSNVATIPHGQLREFNVKKQPRELRSNMRLARNPAREVTRKMRKLANG